MQAWMVVKQEYVLDLDQWHRIGETVQKEEAKGILPKFKALF